MTGDLQITIELHTVDQPLQLYFMGLIPRPDCHYIMCIPGAQDKASYHHAKCEGFSLAGTGVGDRLSRQNHIL